MPLTITVPEMTRYLLTLDQSVDLVLHALSNARGGEIFVRKAPACTVDLLADVMRRKYSRRGARHPVRNIGIRPGEKLHEILVNEYEMQRVTEAKDYFTIHPDYRVPGRLAKKALGSEYTSANTRQLTRRAQLDALLDAMGPGETYL